ncbi:hypothetical protein JAB6_21830 [Janthinobacterium sp. HH104]|uniref:hypothetical protein n=1 Tax=Janthinobacterium sp. HH104 TaxID=1537276 RepID=UPI000893D55F|nr:hypothetical protein [Janthinobacterium sp. HH104]OEZ85334.1 hypothetical protein JAB6_21830 [Janthinobacterium sp. HH104]
MIDQPKGPAQEGLFSNALFDVEHALGMYAFNSCTIFAEDIYDKNILAPLMRVIESCHIYIIGYTPAIRFLDARQDSNQLEMDFSVANLSHTISINLPQGLLLRQRDGFSILEDESGKTFWPNEDFLKHKIEEKVGMLKFNVKYIGQAYGKDGSRNAIDRLLKHETLQKIAIKGVPEGYRLTILMLAIQPNNQLFTVMNPFAKKKDDDGKRIRDGISKLFNTTEQERISLYEAALIRYFYPEFNKEFKDSFPSTNLKILQDCYEKDFGGVVAEICIDGLAFRLCSEKVEPTPHHIARHSLHKVEERKMFFGF